MTVAVATAVGTVILLLVSVVGVTVYIGDIKSCVAVVEAVIGRIEKSYDSLIEAVRRQTERLDGLSSIGEVNRSVSPARARGHFPFGPRGSTVSGRHAVLAVDVEDDDITFRLRRSAATAHS
jgi:hypothetical protein